MPRPLAYDPKNPFKITLMAGAAAMSVALGLGTKWEGRRHYAYDDKQPAIVLTVNTKLKGVLSVCDGHTNLAGTAPPIVIGRFYSDAECDDLSRKDHKVADEAVRKWTPNLYANPSTAGAAIDFAYNVGGPRYGTTTMVKLFRAGDIEAGCQQLLRFKYQGTIEVPGLLNRRKDELATCIKDLEQ
jgi:lysozyme